MELDRLDRQLLNLVQDDGSQTAEQLAGRVALSPSAIQRRLRRLREAGVIARDVAIVDPRRIDPSTTFIALLHIERESAESLAQLRVWIAAEAQVQQAFYVTGEVDFFLIVTARDAERYEALMARLLRENPHVKRFTTHVALGLVKRGLMIPLTDEAH